MARRDCAAVEHGQPIADLDRLPRQQASSRFGIVAQPLQESERAPFDLGVS